MPLDVEKKRQVKKAILFFLEGGLTDKDEIYTRISKDFKVSKTDVMEIGKELMKESTEK